MTSQVLVPVTSLYFYDMKKILLFILGSVFFMSTYAQITISSNDLLDVGDSVKLANVADVPTGFDPGPPGTAQHWDFSAFVMDTTSMIYFSDPAGTPYASSFPTSNIAVEGMYEDAYAYTTKNNFIFQIDGLAGSYDIFEDIVANFDPPEVMFSFPVNYLDSMDQISVVEVVLPSPTPPADSIRVKVVTSVNTKVDAWGELTTPIWSGDVLRLRDVRVRIDSAWMKLIGFWVYLETNTTITINYKYLANDVGYPVVQFSVDTSGSVYSAINYHHDAGLGENELYTNNDIVFDIYPNPASTSIYCRMLKVKVEGEMVIYDITGREMDKVMILPGTKQYRVDVSAYPPGLYHMILKTASEILGQKKLVVN